MFVNFTQYNPWVYFPLESLFYISTMNDSFCFSVNVLSMFVFICLCILYQCLQWYFCMIYMIYSLVVLHLGILVIYIYCIWVIMQFFPSLLICINNILLKYICLGLPFICWMHRKHIYLLLISQYLIYMILF